MGVESFLLSLVCTDVGIGGGTDGGDGHGPCWCRTDDHWRTSGLDVGGVVARCAVCCCEHVDEEAIYAVGVAAGHRDEYSAFELIGIGTSGGVIQSGSDEFGSSSSHFFRSGGGDVGVVFSFISSVNM
jgi:hypothetical protein